MHDAYARVMLTLIAAALVVLVLIEGGWLERRGAPEDGARESAQVGAPGRYQYTPVRYGPLGNFVLRFDSATGKLERVRFPASEVVWEEVGVLPPGQEPKPDPLRAAAPGMPGGVSLGGPGIVVPGLQPGSPPPAQAVPAPPKAKAPPQGGGAAGTP